MFGELGATRVTVGAVLSTVMVADAEVPEPAGIVPTVPFTPARLNDSEVAPLGALALVVVIVYGPAPEPVIEETLQPEVPTNVMSLESTPVTAPVKVKL